MDELAVSTAVYCPPEEIYGFLVDFPRYANYSKHLTDVARTEGDGSPGTRYALRFAWWKLSYTVRSEVTAVDPPERIDWRIVRGLDATGRWEIEPLDDPPADAPADAEWACRVRFLVSFDPRSADVDSLDLPRFISLDWVVEKLEPALEREARRVVERAVEDLEGERRPIDLTVRTG